MRDANRMSTPEQPSRSAHSPFTAWPDSKVGNIFMLVLTGLLLLKPIYTAYTMATYRHSFVLDGQLHTLTNSVEDIVGQFLQDFCVNWIIWYLIVTAIRYGSHRLSLLERFHKYVAISKQKAEIADLKRRVEIEELRKKLAASNQSSESEQ